jgi:hypothetical protein
LNKVQTALIPFVHGYRKHCLPGFPISFWGSEARRVDSEQGFHNALLW